MFALSPGKTDNLTSKEILPSDQGRMIEQATFSYSPIEKALKNK